MKRIQLAGALRTRRIVGRERELETLGHAVRAVGELCILYVTGDGGIGKTRLLEELPRLVAEAEAEGGSYGNCGLLDLYLSSRQSIVKLAGEIVAALDPEGKGFGAYRQVEPELERMTQEAGHARDIEELSLSAQQAFIAGFNEASAGRRVVLALDTVEMLQYESDSIQEMCRAEPTSLYLKDWLLTTIPRLHNAAIILAGREVPPLLADVERHLGQHLTMMRLGGFSEADTLEYLAAVAEVEPALRQAGLGSEQQCVIHHYSGGLPMKIAFVIETLIRQHRLPAPYYDTLVEAQARQGGLEEIRSQVDAALVRGIMIGRDDIATALPYVALARKGINRELLCRLTEWPSSRCRRVLHHLARLSFVKIRPGAEGWLFLHDDMYDLMDRYAWRQMEPERRYFCQVILEYYQERLERGARLSRAQRQDLLVEQLYYQFLENPARGYSRYARLSDSALADHEIDLDMRLRDEMLRFSNFYAERMSRHQLPREFIDRDAALRWVKRHLYAHRYDEAIKVAERAQGLLAAPEYRMVRAELAVYHAQALLYTGKVEQPIAMLRAVIEELEGEQEPAAPVRGDSDGSLEAWRRNLILGRAHNNLGYAYRRQTGQYRAALEHFRAALPYFVASDLQEEAANAADGLGRVHALLGERIPAELLVRHGLRQRRRLGRRLREALSLNSQAVVHLCFREPHHACRVSGRAFQTFSGLGARRYEGLAGVTLGSALRQLAALWRVGLYQAEESIRLLDRSANILSQAISIFEGPIDEPTRLIEALNELGCTHRERAALLRRTRGNSPQLGQEQEAAVACLQRAATLAQQDAFRNDICYVDSCEDLAEVYLEAQEWGEAEAWLARAEVRVPERYSIRPGREADDAAGAEIAEELWRLLGKIELVRGHLALDRSRVETGRVARDVLEQALAHYVLAVAYFARFSPRATELRLAAEQLYARLEGCERDELARAYREVVPQLAQSYGLNGEGVGRFFADTLGLAMRLAPVPSWELETAG